ncbi:MAG: YchJ family protein [Kiritimatiellales bacterium]
MKTIECPCGSGENFQGCCGPWLSGKKSAPTAEALMRSRYTAYVLKNVDYLVETTLPASREPDLAESIRDWIGQVTWQKLHVLQVEAGGQSDNEGTVEFIAEFIGPHGADRHHERSLFKKVRGVWFYAEVLR